MVPTVLTRVTLVELWLTIDGGPCVYIQVFFQIRLINEYLIRMTSTHMKTYVHIKLIRLPAGDHRPFMNRSLDVSNFYQWSLELRFIKVLLYMYS